MNSLLKCTLARVIHLIQRDFYLVFLLFLNVVVPLTFCPPNVSINNLLFGAIDVCHMSIYKLFYGFQQFKYFITQDLN